MATQSQPPERPAPTKANNPTKNNPATGIARKGGTPPARQSRPRASDAATGKKSRGVDR